MKDDEREFARVMRARCTRHTHDHQTVWGETPREIINSPGFAMNHKRAWYLLEKWCGRGWYDFGVALDLGFLTAEGFDALSE